MSSAPNQPQAQQAAWKTTVLAITSFPSKFVIASTLIFVNIFQTLAQERKLKEMVLQINENPKANQQAKEELFAYLSEFNSVHTTLYPIMIKEYSRGAMEEEYRIGLLINGDVNWQEITLKIKEHIKVHPQVSLSFFCEKKVINQGNIKDLHARHRREDGIMYIQYIRMEAYG